MMMKPSLDFRFGWGLVVCLLLLQLYSRYMPSPWTVLVADDWSNFARSSFYASPADAAWTGLQDPNRPFSTMAVETGFHVMRDRSGYWTLLSIVANSLLLIGLMKMTLELTGSRRIAAIQGILFALLPNLTETFHWSTQVLNEVFCALVFYVISGWLWVAFIRRGGAWRLGLSALTYGVGLFSYEAGIFLPAAYLMLIAWRRSPLRGLLRMAPYGAVLCFYVAWRLTDAFGMNQSWFYPAHMEAGVSLWSLSWNLRQTVHWWVGDNLFGAVLAGWQSFATIDPWTRRWLVAGNVLVVLLIGFWLRRTRTEERTAGTAWPFHPLRIALFGLTWAGMAVAVSLLSYSAPRLNVLPAIGFTLLAGLLLSRVPARLWGPVLLVPALISLMANQGTAESFRQAGEFNRRLYDHLERHVDEWRDREVLLVDTRSLRQRLTPGLLRPVGEDQLTWAFYRNAGLLRGFVPGGMVKLITQERNPRVAIVHDVEHGARVTGDTLHWHARYNPERPHTAPMDRVFVVDVHGVTVGN